MEDKNKFLTLCEARYSCRAYDKARPVSRETVMQVLEAARMAPSACNRQPWTFVVVTDEAVRHTILAKSRPAFADAPIVIVACGHHADAWHRPSDGKDHTDVDLSIAVEHICLQAADLGLGTCWVCSFDTEATVEALGLPEGVEPVALIPLGYADTAAPVPAKVRKAPDQVVRWEKY